MSDVNSVIPRWRFSYGWSSGLTIIFKSKRSEWNNVQFCYRPYPWAYKLRRWGIGSVPGWMIGQRMIVIDLGRNRCISIHITSRHARPKVIV